MHIKQLFEIIEKRINLYLDLIVKIKFYIAVTILSLCISSNLQYKEVFSQIKNDNFTLILWYLTFFCFINVFGFYFALSVFDQRNKLINYFPQDYTDWLRNSSAQQNKILPREIFAFKKIREYNLGKSFIYRFLYCIDFDIFYIGSMVLFTKLMIQNNFIEIYLLVSIPAVFYSNFMNLYRLRPIAQKIKIIFYTLFIIFSIFLTTSSRLILSGTPFLILFFLTVIIFAYEDIKIYISQKIILMCFTLMFFFSYFNDNSELDYSEQTYNKQSLSEFFENWIRNFNTSHGDTIPLIFVAAEGGGIRGASWTTLTLRELQTQNSNFKESLFSLSGVSGGGVGSCLYLATCNYNVSDHAIKKILSHDHLSKTVSAYLFRAPFQNFIPYPIKFFDRNEVLENSWSESINEYTGLNHFTFNVNSFYDLTTFTNPALFLNCTIAETGHKAIYSNVSFNKIFNQMDQVIDIHDLTEGKDIKLKSAALLTARFPGITSGALIKSEVGSVHITDGGYIDNSGIETCIQLITSLKSDITNVELGKNITIKPYIIFLQNSDPYIADLPKEPYRFLHEIRQFSGSFYNSWGQSTKQKIDLYKNILPDNGITFISLSLQRSPFGIQKKEDRPTYPLGWQITMDKVNEMADRSKSVTSKFDAKNNQDLLNLYKELDKLK